MSRMDRELRLLDLLLLGICSAVFALGWIAGMRRSSADPALRLREHGPLAARGLGHLIGEVLVHE